jgi:hypothetical protein
MSPAQHRAMLSHARGNAARPLRPSVQLGDRSRAESVFSRWRASRDSPRLMAGSVEAKMLRITGMCLGHNLAQLTRIQRRLGLRTSQAIRRAQPPRRSRLQHHPGPRTP